MKKVLIAISLIAISICIYCLFQNKEYEIIDLDKIKQSVDIETVDYDSLPKENIELVKSLEITEEGIYTLKGEMEGSVLIDTKGDVKLILDGVNIKNNGPSILILNSNSTTIYLNENTTNYLTDTTYSSEEYNANIYSKDNLILDGNGTLIINATQDGIATTDNLKIINGNYEITSKDEGIRGNDSVYILNGNFKINSKDGIKTNNQTDNNLGNIVIENGTFNINTSNDAIQAINNLYIENGEFNIITGGGSINSSTNNKENWTYQQNTTTESAKGLKATNNIIIEKGIYTFDTSDDSIHSNKNVNLKDGTYTISSGDDGIHADSKLTIDNGNIKISKSYEGIEANDIIINNGNISLVSTDDGINISGGNDSSSQNRPGAGNFSNGTGTLTINNGTIKVNSKGDGIDINGKGTITNANVYIEGPTDNGNGFFDYDSSLKITNATVIASGSSGMLQTPTTENMNALLIYLTNANKKITIKQNDKEILTYASAKSYSALYITSPLLKTNNTYDIYLEDELIDTITINSNLTKIGNQTGYTPGPNNQMPPHGRR